MHAKNILYIILYIFNCHCLSTAPSCYISVLNLSSKFEYSRHHHQHKVLHQKADDSRGWDLLELRITFNIMIKTFIWASLSGLIQVLMILSSSSAVFLPLFQMSYIVLISCREELNISADVENCGDVQKYCLKQEH